jgi:hypothetical protein
MDLAQQLHIPWTNVVCSSAERLFSRLSLGGVMKQQEASSFATLRISTVLAMLWALPVGPVSAIPIALTGGGITVESFQISSGDVHTFVFLAGPGFELRTDGYFDQLQFASSPNHPLDLLPLGSITEFSGVM